MYNVRNGIEGLDLPVKVPASAREWEARTESGRRSRSGAAANPRRFIPVTDVKRGSLYFRLQAGWYREVFHFVPA